MTHTCVLSPPATRRNGPRTDRRSTARSRASTPSQGGGRRVFAGGLHPPTSETVVVSKTGEVPPRREFAETKEQLGGFWSSRPPPSTPHSLGGKGTAACMGPVEVRPFQDDPGEAPDA